MRKQPVPGWRTSSAELGLPPGAVPKPIGNVGDQGYFLGITGTGWWLVGIDVATGRRTFAPIELGRSDDALAFDCFVNGPTLVLCVRQDRDPQLPARAWVVDVDKGAVLYDGPTDLRIPPTDGHPNLARVGDYAVATVAGEGVHGVGPRAEFTWFVPGGGRLTQATEWNRDTPPPTRAVQDGAGSPTANVVFSVSDGHVVEPEVPEGQALGRAIVYPGGFGYEYSDRVAFFDDSGRPLSRPDITGTLRTGSPDVPMVETESTDVTLTLDGRRLLDVPKSTLMPYARLIGEKLFVATDEGQRAWQQHDLRTGASGKTCDIEDLGFSYTASDGQVAIVVGRRSPAQAYDLTTCAEIWSVPGSTEGESKDVWRVNTTLIQRTNDELFSLVAPS